MKSLLRCVPLLLLLAGLILSSCELNTIPPDQAVTRPADHLVINEVFTLPSTAVNPYSWVELYNPTGERIVGLNRWRLDYPVHFASSGIDTSFMVSGRLVSIVSEIPDTLEPGQFLVLIGDSIHFYVHTMLGPGKGTATTYIPPFGPPTQGNFRAGFPFLLSESGELVLRDTSGNTVDVVRYGNYVPPSPDPYPGNQSAGMIPEWSSLSRYAGAYSTGNTANDFYMESKPIPMWYSQLNHP
jgi:hypothetical protein